MNEMDIVKALSELGLKPGATVEECHLAWRSLSKKWHPDMHPAGSPEHQEAIDKQRAVNAAYDLVKTADLASLPAAQVEVRVCEQPADSPEVAFEKARQLENSGNLFGAVDAYKRLAHGGLAKAQFRLGYIYFDSIVKDLNQAAIWWKRADQGHRSAQYNLGLMYEQGLGVTMDPKQAHHWFVEAANNGDKAAKAKVGLSNSPLPPLPTAAKPAAEGLPSAAPAAATPPHGSTGEQVGRAFFQRKNKQ